MSSCHRHAASTNFVSPCEGTSAMSRCRCCLAVAEDGALSHCHHSSVFCTTRQRACRPNWAHSRPPHADLRENCGSRGHQLSFSSRFSDFREFVWAGYYCIDWLQRYFCSQRGPASWRCRCCLLLLSWTDFCEGLHCSYLHLVAHRTVKGPLSLSTFVHPSLECDP